MTILTGPIVANLVRMSRQVEKNKTALLVEGDGDSRLYRKSTDDAVCRVFVAGNRPNAEYALADLRASGELGVLAVVDADTDHLEGRVSPSRDLLLTHTRDSECLILRSTVLRNLLVEYNLSENAFGPDPEAAAVLAAKEIAYLRWLSRRNGWGLKLDDLEFDRFIDASDLKCRAQDLFVEAIRVSSGSPLTTVDLAREVAAAPDRDPFKVSRGHDVTSIIAWAIKARTAKKKKLGAKITSFLIEGHLRLGYSREMFQTTDLHREIQAWETRNVPFKILK